MKNYSLYFILVTSWLYTAVGAHGVEQCYFCLSEADGEGCHDPVNLNATRIHNCAENTLEPISSYLVKQQDLRPSLYDSSFTADASLRTTHDHICMTVSYINNNQLITQRGCESYSFNETLTTCEFFPTILPNRITNFTCEVCHNNLCNNSPVFKTSIWTIVLAATAMFLLHQ
ncbi:uncharacterized protein LOC132699327 [Cylas formicarius]|uniref:uncharacterized protein LOC132699327 n=1 Tax=Cylas formicarius TaxID=197179 RepID=UPI002958945E|nr:uncharacterized protein LOC132699327 [Cylas formicarius]